MIRWGFALYGVQNMLKLSKHERQLLAENSNILKLTDHHVIYKPSFKLHAIEQYLQGFSGDEIFEKEGICLDFFIKNYAASNIKRWLKKYNEDGAAAFGAGIRKAGSGRPKKSDNLTYEELLKLVEIQNGVIDTLKKKRALALKK